MPLPWTTSPLSSKSTSLSSSCSPLCRPPDFLRVKNLHFSVLSLYRAPCRPPPMLRWSTSGWSFALSTHFARCFSFFKINPFCQVLPFSRTTHFVSCTFLKIISFIQYIVLTLFFTQVFLHALRQKVKEVENMSVAIHDNTLSRRKFLIICLEKGFILAALVFFVSFWAIAFHNVYTSSVFAFSCDFK